MTVVTLIAAVARNGVIGRDGDLVWSSAEDMAHFKAVTAGKPVIMGRKTWESLPVRFRPLPGRPNLVISRQDGYIAQGAEVFGSVETALAAAGEDACVIGGAEIYRQAMRFATRLEITHIDMDIDGDAYFPTIDPGTWRIFSTRVGDGAIFATYIRQFTSHPDVI